MRNRNNKESGIAPLSAGPAGLRDLSPALADQNASLDLLSSAHGSRPHSAPTWSVPKLLGLAPLDLDWLMTLVEFTGAPINLRPASPVRCRKQGRTRTTVRAPFAPGFMFLLPRMHEPWFRLSFTAGEMFPRFPTPKQYRENEFGKIEQPEAYRISRVLDVYLLLRLLNGRISRFQDMVEEVLNFIHTRYGGTRPSRGPARIEAHLGIGAWSPDPALSSTIFKPIAWSHTRGSSVLLFSQRRPASRRSPNKAEKASALDEAPKQCPLCSCPLASWVPLCPECGLSFRPSGPNGTVQNGDSATIHGVTIIADDRVPPGVLIPVDLVENLRVAEELKRAAGPNERDVTDKGLSPVEKLRRELRERGSLFEEEK